MFWGIVWTTPRFYSSLAVMERALHKGIVDPWEVHSKSRKVIPFHSTNAKYSSILLNINLDI